MQTKSFVTNNAKTQLEIDNGRLRGKITLSNKIHLIQCIFCSILGVIPLIVSCSPIRDNVAYIMEGDIFTIIFSLVWVLPSIPLLCIALLGFFYPKVFRFEYSEEYGFSSNYFILNWLWKGKKLAILVTVSSSDGERRSKWGSQLLFIRRGEKGKNSLRGKKRRLAVPIAFAPYDCENREEALLRAHSHRDFFKKSTLSTPVVIYKQLNERAH